jgi:type I restriction enzyme M protein
MVASMAAGTGRMAVVLPQGALFRKDAEGRIRRALLEQDLIESVIGLAPNIFFGTGLAPAVVVLRRVKATAHRHKVLIVDASSLFLPGRAQNSLTLEHGAQIVAWVRAFSDVADRAKVGSLDQIAADDWTLNISRYVTPRGGEGIPSLPEAMVAFKHAVARARVAEERLREVLTEGGWKKPSKIMCDSAMVVSRGKPMLLASAPAPVSRRPPSSNPAGCSRMTRPSSSSRAGTERTPCDHLAS